MPERSDATGMAKAVPCLKGSDTLRRGSDGREPESPEEAGEGSGCDGVWCEDVDSSEASGAL